MRLYVPSSKISASGREVVKKPAAHLRKARSVGGGQAIDESSQQIGENRSQ